MSDPKHVWKTFWRVAATVVVVPGGGLHWPEVEDAIVVWLFLSLFLFLCTAGLLLWLIWRKRKKR